MEKRIDRVIFTCGGMAGHVNPAIAVAQLMAEKNPQIKILFVGAERGLEKDLIPKAGYEFRTVHISAFTAPSSWRRSSTIWCPSTIWSAPRQRPGLF
ncbi:MAG: glycosyltransferase [Dysosmobacter sp.]